MEHLNYCRHMVKQFTERMEDPSFPADYRWLLSHPIDLARTSTKFILPDGGCLYDDPEYRALDETQELHLPQKIIALEYSLPRPETFSGEVWVPRTIVFAREQDEAIVITPVLWVDFRKTWAPMPEMAIPRVGYLDRGAVIEGRVAIRGWVSNPRVSLDEYAQEAWSLLCFLNVLQCGNVRVERSEPKRIGKKVKAALPFDTYHILTINTGKGGDGIVGASVGTHRSPREHLRRGHIRRLPDGRRVWVNATVVGAGKGVGVVTKDYKVRGANEVRTWEGC